MSKTKGALIGAGIGAIAGGAGNYFRKNKDERSAKDALIGAGVGGAAGAGVGYLAGKAKREAPPTVDTPKREAPPTVDTPKREAPPTVDTPKREAPKSYLHDNPEMAAKLKERASTPQNFRRARIERMRRSENKSNKAWLQTDRDNAKGRRVDYNMFHNFKKPNKDIPIQERATTPKNVAKLSIDARRRNRNDKDAQSINRKFIPLTRDDAIRRAKLYKKMRARE